MPFAVPLPLAARPAGAAPAAAVATAVSWGNIVRLLLAAALLAIGWSVAGDPRLQWDFHVFYFAGKAWSLGLNPYRSDVLAQWLGGSMLTYVYPPDTLWVFHVFNALDPHAASCVYLLIQLGAAIALYACWQRFFLSREDAASPWFAAFCLFGLGGALTTDLRVGNISLIEQVLLWSALAAYLRERTGWFCVLLWLAAAFKLTLLAFSGLLLLGPVRHWGKFALVWAAMAGRLALDYVVNPPRFLGFVHVLACMDAGSETKGGTNNPSLPEFLKDLVRFGLGLEDESLVWLVAYILYALAFLAVVLLTLRAWRAVRAAGTDAADEPSGERGVLLVCLFCVGYGLLVPRLKDYSCILLLLPIWRLMKFSLAGKRDAWLALIAAACLSNRSEWFGVHAAYVFLWRYQALALTFAAWAFFVHAVLSPRATPRALSPPAA